MTTPVSGQGPSYEPRRPASAAPVALPEHVPALVADVYRRATELTWSKGRPLSEAVNFHKTNTKGDFQAALKSDANWFEGDVRTELNPPHALEMRHDQGAEAGDNLTLVEWLAAGKKTGRGLKLDVKEGARLAEILDAAQAAQIPSERLMFNLGDGDMARWAGEIRRRFPDAILAINPTTSLNGQANEGPLQDWQVARMIELARVGGAPVAFVVRHDLLTDRAIQQLKPYGDVSIWNSRGQGGLDAQAIPALTADFRRRGVTGVIDLQPSYSTWDKVGLGWDVGRAWLDNQAGKALSGAKRLLGKFL